MPRHASPFLSAALLASLASGCASGGSQPPITPTPAAQPAAAAPAPATAIAPVEPGRFDMGKMWTFENPPIDYFQEAYGFQPTTEWFDQVRLATLRIPGCTASFVSTSGLIMSNHHCARDAASAVTREGENLLDDGFYAPTLADERPVPDMWADQMVQIHDVTQLIESAIAAGMDDDAQVEAIGERIGAVGDSASYATGLECDVTPLYQGAKYSMYCYKRYTDVRLVFVPELQLGFFGGDWDNFTYPRYDLDVSFFRVYDENGSPLTPAAHFAFTKTGAQVGDATFVIGNPGSTERLGTFSQLEFFRDYREPTIVRLLKTRSDILAMYMNHHPDRRAQYINDYFGLMNSLKAYMGQERALRDPELMGRRLGFERQFRNAVQGNPTLNAKYGHLWDEVANLRQEMAKSYPTLMALGIGGFLRSRTLETASLMLQHAQAASAGMPDSLLQRMRMRVMAQEIEPDLDAHMLEAQISDAIAWLGADDPWVVKALAGRKPAEAARAIISESNNIVDMAAREAQLADPAAILSASAPAFALVREALPRFREAVMEYQRLEETEALRITKLARALFDVYGTKLPPDATFTLRIADGVVQGYEYNGTKAPAWTTFYGMYDRYYSHKGSPEWALPQRWTRPPAGFDLGTPFNMVSTNDAVGGNSGSPVINVNREIVGLLFDGNMESLAGNFIFTTEANRSVSVRAEAIAAALRHIYAADRIVKELLGGN